MSFFCHKEYLMKRSDYFSGMFRNPMNESSQQVISTTGLPVKSGVLFEYILGFLYSGLFEEIPPNWVILALQNATYLGIDALVKQLFEKLAEWVPRSVVSVSKTTFQEPFLCQLLTTLSPNLSASAMMNLILEWSSSSSQKVDKTAKELVKKFCDLSKLRITDINEKCVQLFSKEDIWKIAQQSK